MDDQQDSGHTPVEFSVSAQAEPSAPEAEAMRLHTLAEAVMEASYDGLCILDANGVILEMNAAYERISGLKRSEWIGRNLDELRKLPASARHWTARYSAAQQVMEGNWPATTLANARGGEMILVTGNPYLGPDGKILNIILNLRNITQLNHLKYQIERGRGETKLADLERFRTGYLQARLKAAGIKDIAIESPIMNKIVSTVLQIADFHTSVLLEGETGTGKGVIAQLIHRLSRRAAGPFVEVNCGALPETLVESEFYGYQPGAFTGSLRSGKKGQFELANGGTIFLDEVSELPLISQTKLLKFLDDKMIQPLGGTAPRRLDVRIVAATNKNLRELAQAGQFRKDLLYRLEVIPIYVPALRERREDLRALLYLFIDQFNREFGVNRALGSEALRVLLEYDYPGNIRELRNLMARLVLTTRELEITVNDLPDYVRASCPQPALERIALERMTLEPVENAEGEPEQVNLREKMQEFERRLLAYYARQCHSTYELADRVGVNQSSVARKLRKHGIALGRRSDDASPEVPSTDQPGLRPADA